MATVSDDVFGFVQRCQTVVGSWQEGSTATQLSSLWDCLEHIPRPCTLEDRITISSAFLRLAIGALQCTRSATSHDAWVAAGMFRPVTRRASPHVRVSQLLTLLATRFREPHLTLSALARTLGLSQPYLSRAIHRETGQPFCTHLNGFRLLAATVLLRATSLSIKETAAAVGYSRTSELDRQCRRLLYMTPQQIRRAVQGHVPHPRKLAPHVKASVGIWRAQPAEIADMLDIDLGFVLRLRGIPSRLVPAKD